MEGPIRVLHVDDEADFASMTAEFLERESDRLSVVKVTSAAAGLDRLERDEIDCIVSDYQMPELDGLAFLEAVRADHADLPFILFTGKGSEDVASDAITAGATDYLQKKPGVEQYTLLANRIVNAVVQYRAAKRAENLERVQNVVRSANQALVRAESRAEIERRICAIISDADPYAFAWIGEHDPETGAVVPRAAAGVEEGYLEAIEITTDEEPTGQGPTGRAIRTRELVVVQNIPEEAAYEPWRAHALERGYRSSAAIPLVHDDTLFGVLNVYADRVDAFDTDERQLLTELAADIAHALAHVQVSARHERYERLVESAPIGVFRVTPEPDGEVVDVNPGFATIFHADSPAELVGRPVTDFYQNPEDRAALSEQLEREGVVQSKELHQERLDGEELWLSVTAIRTEEDGEVYFDGIVHDITDRKAHERDLRLFREAVEASGHSIYFTAPDGTIEYVNPAFEEISGYAAEEAIGQTPAILNSGEHDPAFFQSLWETILRGDVWREELINRRKSGERYVVDQTIAPVTDEDGDIAYFVAVNADITEQEERKEELREQAERLNEYARVISHDLRNPLAVAQGEATLAQSEGTDEHLGAIVRALDRMEAIIEDTLTLAREGDVVGEMEAIAGPELIEDCWRMVTTDASTLEVVDSFSFWGDRDRVRLVFENLFRNAVEHGGPGVHVRVGRLDGYGFYVADDGPGIPAADRDRVFAPSYSTAADGTGLGLTIVRQIAEAHDWAVTVTESVDGGARFEFSGVDISS